MDIANGTSFDAGQHVVFVAKHRDHQSLALWVALQGTANDV
jgi:hypothetical protein